MSETKSTAYPRVLVIDKAPFSQDSSSGLTKSRLFTGWPKEKLACLYHVDTVPDWEICQNYWKLTYRNLKHLGFLYSGIRKQEIKMIRDYSNDPKVSSKTNGIRIKVKNFTWEIRKRMAGLSLTQLDTFRIPQQLITEIQSFHPDLIYTMLDNNTVLQLAIDVAKSIRIPIVPHFMDDWPNTLYTTSILSYPLRKTMFKKIDTVLHLSPTRLVIGDAMAREYTDRYGGEFSPFMNIVESELLNYPCEPPPQRQGIRLVYIGGLHLNRWRSLLDIGMALKKLLNEGFIAEVLVYSPLEFAEEAKKLQLPPVMRYVGSLKPSEVPSALRDADILLHVESFDHASMAHARYSISTKIPEYMSATRPIFAYGPKALASIGYIREMGVGLVVDEENQDLVIQTLRELLVSKSLRDSMGLKGFQIASRNHNAGFQREKFRSLLLKSTGFNG